MLQSRESIVDVPICEDNSLTTVLTQLRLGQEIPESLYQTVV